MNIKRIRKALEIFDLNIEFAELYMQLNRTPKSDLDKKKIMLKVKTKALVNHDRVINWDRRGLVK
jgi:hypothetical protein